MAGKPNEKQITFYIDSVERDQFQSLCKTLNMSAANVLRKWIQQALETGSIQSQATYNLSTETTNITENDVIKNILTRLNEIEKNTAYLNDNQMEFIKDEVLGSSMGTLRNRIGVVEHQVQELGGNITQ